jgi:5-methylcytosine-specific restriction enzyme A
VRTIPEWVAAHDDQPVPRRVLLRVYLKYDGKCPACQRMLRAGHWDCDHIIALENGGEHRENNLQPLCKSPCHSKKSAADRVMKARADKRQKHNSGIKKERSIRAWRKFDGTPVYASRLR